MARQKRKETPRPLVIADDAIREAVPAQRGRPAGVPDEQRRDLRRKMYMLGDEVARQAELAMAATTGGVDPQIEMALKALHEIEFVDANQDIKHRDKAIAALNMAARRKAETPDWNARLPAMNMVISRLMPSLKAVAVQHRNEDATAEAIANLDQRGMARVLAQLLGAPKEVIDAAFEIEDEAPALETMPTTDEGGGDDPDSGAEDSV
jgi:hypothetical protein